MEKVKQMQDYAELIKQERIFLQREDRKDLIRS